MARVGVPLSAATEERLAAVFPTPEDAEQARRMLERECGSNLPFLQDGTPESLERFRFAALKLSGGSLEELRRAVRLAQMDWRDLLMAADFGRDLHAHEAWEP